MLKYEDMINYPKAAEADYSIIGTHTKDGIIRSDILLNTSFGYKRIGEIIRPEEGENLAAALFIHWYEPAEPSTSNRFQFVEEAIELAKKGTVCLCIETLWSDLDFFYKRTQADDIENSCREIVTLRRFMDILFLQPGIDKERTLLVGHDFGGMYGLLLGSLDNRIKNFVIMSATAKFSDWYLYYPEMEADEKERFIKDISDFDPLTSVKKIEEPILFQFGKGDPHVPLDKADELYNAAGHSKEKICYDSGHGLNSGATKDRKKWIYTKLFK